MDFFTIWFVIYILVNALFAIPVAYVASSTGRSAPGFFFLSFFFSFLVGILVVLAVPRLDSQTVITSDSGAFARRGSDELFKCPYCAEWVKSEAKVCRFCGKDIATEIAQSSAKDKQALEQQNKANEERNRAYAKEQLELKEAKKRKLLDFIRKPWVIGVSSIISLGVIGALAATFLNINSERQQLIESKSDWTALAKSCEGFLYVDGGDTYEVRNSGKEIVINAYYLAGNPFIDCLGQKIAIDAPTENNLGIHIMYAGDRWSGGGLGTMTTEYGDLGVTANRVGENSFIVTIISTR